jgi:hypothetical protein
MADPSGKIPFETEDIHHIQGNTSIGNFQSRIGGSGGQKGSNWIQNKTKCRIAAELIEQKHFGRSRCFHCKHIESIRCGGVDGGVLFDGSGEEDPTMSVSASTSTSGSGEIQDRHLLRLKRSTGRVPGPALESLTLPPDEQQNDHDDQRCQGDHGRVQDAAICLHVRN